MAGNRPPSYERREVSRRKEKLFLSVVRVVFILKRMCGKLEMRPVATIIVAPIYPPFHIQAHGKAAAPIPPLRDSFIPFLFSAD